MSVNSMGPTGHSPIVISPDSLDILASEVRACTRCGLSATRMQAVPSEAHLSARILLVGESPGATEDRLGRNFCGLSGKFLDRCLEQAGLSRRDVNVTPILHCHPPGNRNPLPDEANACLTFFHRHFALVDPAIVDVMGGVDARWYLGEKSITSIAGAWRDIEGRPHLFTYHPAAGVRFPAKREAMHAHFKELSERARQIGILG